MPATIRQVEAPGHETVMKLGEILVQLGLLSPEQLKTILAERNVLGAKIGTQLVERGFLETDQVTEGLSRQMGVPAAMQRHFDKADPGVVALLKPNLAARYMALPLVAARSGPKRIVVAMATPQDVLCVDDVSFALGARVEPMVAAELAIARALKRMHNIDVNLLRPAQPEPPPSTRRALSSREIPVLAPAVAPIRRPTPAFVAETPPVFPTLAPPPQAAVALEDALHRMSVAEHREQIADILLDFMLPRFACGLIFLLRGPNAEVWRGFAPGIDARAVETISFPISVPSMFRTAKDRGVTFRGAPPMDGVHLHNQVWKYLRCEAPVDVVIIPITIGERVICQIYAHASPGLRLDDDQVHELQAMGNAVGSAFVRLIQQAKEGRLPTTLHPR
jgi:hypothetical protein